MTRPAGRLGLDPDTLNACVSCGLCLPHCPTYRVTGREIASPRGRIAAMRAVESGDAPIDDTFRRAMEECVSCRGCEAACPSGVHFGELMEGTRAALPPPRSFVRRTAEWLGYAVVLPRHWLLIALTWLAWAGQRLHLVPAQLGLPRLSARSLRHPLDVPIGGDPDAWLFTGCVMDAWMRDTHRSAARVMRAAGANLARPPAAAACCGALHLHAGREAEARKLAARVVASMPGDGAVVVDSAGCGAAMKEYGMLLDTPAAHAFSARVKDFSEWLAEQPALMLHPMRTRVVVQDPCHLRHVQKKHGAVRAVLGTAYELVETADEGLCCGAGGAYAIAQRDLSQRILGRKVDALCAAAGNATPLVASANPGCLVQLRGAGIDARHPADLVAEALMTGGHA
jgi:glycolate oxidase iron-sulfur subunit